MITLNNSSLSKLTKLIGKALPAYPSLERSRSVVPCFTRTLPTEVPEYYQGDRQKVEGHWYRMIGTVSPNSNGSLERPLLHRIILITEE